MRSPKDDARIIMGLQCNYVSILKAGHQDLERITVGWNLHNSRIFCKRSFSQPSEKFCQSCTVYPPPYCTLSTILHIACSGFGCCNIVPSVQCLLHGTWTFWLEYHTGRQHFRPAFYTGPGLFWTIGTWISGPLPTINTKRSLTSHWPDNEQQARWSSEIFY